MTKSGSYSRLTGILVFLCGGLLLRAESQPQSSDFQEVYGLIRSHLPGVTDAELDQTAVQALVSALSPRVTMAGAAGLTNAPSAHTPMTRATLFEGQIAVVRFSRVDQGLAQTLGQQLRNVTGTNKLNGVVLDLRFAAGMDYAAAAEAAGLFIAKEKPLMDWGTGMVRSKAKGDAVTVPAAVLVNRQTSGAAEALAGVLRQAGAGLIVGGVTAGHAMMGQEYPLKSGHRLRIGTGPLQLGDGSTVSMQGLKPDIAVEVSPEEERAYMADAFKEAFSTNLVAGASSTETNQTLASRMRRIRLNEAELVREKREGINPDSLLRESREMGAEKPLVRDPALARALDVLKGLALIRSSRL